MPCMHQWRQSWVAAGEVVESAVVRGTEECGAPLGAEDMVLVDALVDP
jgi:hypothetical protein